MLDCHKFALGEKDTTVTISDQVSIERVESFTNLAQVIHIVVVLCLYQGYSVLREPELSPFLHGFSLINLSCYSERWRSGSLQSDSPCSDPLFLGALSKLLILA